MPPPRSHVSNQGPAAFRRPDRLLTADWVFLGAALFLGLGLRLYGSSFDLPYVYDPDEPSFVNPALHMLQHGTLNPGWFGHPGSTTIYVNALIYKVLLEFGTYVGWFANVKQFQDFYHRDATLFYLLPRIFYGFVGT